MLSKFWKCHWNILNKSDYFGFKNMFCLCSSHTIRRKKTLNILKINIVLFASKSKTNENIRKKNISLFTGITFFTGILAHTCFVGIYIVFITHKSLSAETWCNFNLRVIRSILYYKWVMFLMLLKFLFTISKKIKKNRQWNKNWLQKSRE